MAATLATLISETEDHLLAGDRDEINQLPSLVDSAVTTWPLQRDLGGIQPGSYLACDLEIAYVWSVNESAKTAEVQRAMLGSTAAAHISGSLVYVNPKFSKYRMLTEINNELRDVSTPPNGLWQVKSFTTTSQPVQKTYTVPTPNLDLLDILEIRYQPPGPELRWDRIWNREISVMRNMPTTGSGAFTTGMGFRIDQPLYPGRTMTVRYAAPFGELSALTDDVATVTGLPSTAFDIPSLGAAARLMGVREAKRTFVESEVDTRRSGEVPVGSSSKAAQTLLSLLNERVRSELARLVRQWPQMQ